MFCLFCGQVCFGCGCFAVVVHVAVHIGIYFAKRRRLLSPMVFFPLNDHVETTPVARNCDVLNGWVIIVLVLFVVKSLLLRISLECDVNIVNNIW